MEQQSFLIGFAQIALVLTGFVSIFVVFLIDKNEKSRVNTHHATSILVGSVVTLLGTFAPIVLFHYGLMGEELWWWSSVVFMVLASAYFISMASLTFQLTKEQFKEAGYIHMASSYALGFTAAGVNLLNLIGTPSAGHYVLALIVNLLVPLIAFVTFSAQRVFHW